MEIEYDLNQDKDSQNLLSFPCGRVIDLIIITYVTVQPYRHSLLLLQARAEGKGQRAQVSLGLALRISGSGLGEQTPGDSRGLQGTPGDQASC